MEKFYKSTMNLSNPKNRKNINWSSYNQTLQKRGSLTLFIEEDTLENWQQTGQKVQGGNKYYSDLAIIVCLQFRQLLKMPLRQTTGFMQSLFQLMKVEQCVPDYTTLSRRTASLKVQLPPFQEGTNHTLIIDSTGLQMYEGGEWAARKRGYKRHKRWRKLHLVIDQQNQIIQAGALTTNSIDDAEMTHKLLEKVPPTTQKIIADAAYDKCKVYDFLDTKGIEPVINPRKNGVESKKKTKAYKARNKALRGLENETTREKWKEETQYSQRALVETTMFRYKRICGEKLLSRKLENQKIEVLLNCQMLNLMRSLALHMYKKTT